MFDELDDSEIVLSLPESHGGGAVGWDVVVWIAVTAAAVKATMQLLSFRRKNDLIAMTLGLQCLAFWYLLHILDGILQIRRVTSDGYIIGQAIFWAVRLSADVLTLSGSALLARRFIFFEFNDQLWWNLPFGIPLFFALSHLGMLFAVDATWLAYSSSSPPETETIHNIAKGHTALGAVYCAVQFIITLAMCAVIALHEDELARGAKRLFSKDFKPMSLAYQVGLAMLIFRSFCEVVIAGEIDRTSPDPDTFVEIHRARCVIYGLASIPFAWCMTYAMGIGGKDVVTELKDEVEPEIRQLLKDRLTLLTEDGAKTAPQLEPILLELERQVEDARKNQNNSPPSGQDNPPSGLDPNASLHSNPNHLFGRDASGSNSRPRNDAKDEKDELRHHLKVRFIKRLIGRYADWEPILKQDSQVIASQGTGNPPI